MKRRLAKEKQELREMKNKMRAANIKYQEIDKAQQQPKRNKKEAKKAIEDALQVAQ